MTIAHENKITVKPKKLKQLMVEFHQDAPIKDDTRWYVFSISGLKINERELAEYLAYVYDCEVSVASYSGVKVERAPKFWTFWEKVKFLFE